MSFIIPVVSFLVLLYWFNPLTAQPHTAAQSLPHGAMKRESEGPKLENLWVVVKTV